MEEVHLSKTGVIVVLYHPSIKDLKTMVSNVLRMEDTCLILVDNTPNPILSVEEFDSTVEYIPLFVNKGIAEAQNVGIQKALDLGCQYITFFDQDSIVPVNYLKQLIQGYQDVSAKGIKVATIGPRIIDKTNGTEYKSLIHSSSTEEEFIPVRQIISSGSLIPVAVLRQVGSMDAKLFIDYVDHEWCWRANAEGYKCIKMNRLLLEHQIGYDSLQIGHYKIELSSPVRYFYQYRNYLILIRRNYVPLYWKIAHGVKLCIHFIVLPWFVKEKKATWQYMIKGIIAAL